MLSDAVAATVSYDLMYKVVVHPIFFALESCMTMKLALLTISLTAPCVLKVLVHYL